MNSSENNILRLSGNEFFPASDFRLAVVGKHAGSSRNDWLDYTYMPHYHDFSEMVLVTRGEGTQNIDGVDFPLRQGDLFLLEGKTVHFFRKSADFALLNLLFDRQTLDLPWERFQRCKGYNLFFMVEPRLRTPRTFCHRLHLPFSQQKTLENMLLNLQTLLLDKKAGNDLMALARLIEIILFVSNLYEERQNHDDDMLPRIGETVALLEKNFPRDFSLEELARRACMSTRNFTRCFKRGTGMSPIAFLQAVRLRHAAGLLKNSSERISEIAFQCGFRDSNYFTKMFALYYGISPGAYRKLGSQLPAGDLQRTNKKSLRKSE